MPTNTYVALSTHTVPSAVSSYTFTSIPQGYTDLVVVCNFITSAAQSVEARVGNGSIDTGNNYSNTALIGKANNTAVSTRRSNFSYFTFFEQNGASSGTWIMNFQNYSNTTTFKTMLGRNGSASSDVEASAQLWRSTSAINTLQLFAGQGGITFSAGSTFSLYGIAASGVSPAAKATGGAIYADDTYYYHVFGSTGTFTPLQSLTTDVLVVAGGGAGGNGYGGGGGAGGVSYQTGRSVTATAYTVTVGAAGAGNLSGYSVGGSGGNSVFDTITSNGGGGGGHGGGGPSNATSGGSGGGGGSGSSAGTTTQGNTGGATGYGSNGANGSAGGTSANPGGGGGSGAAGSSSNGGNGLSTWSSWGTATGVGQNVSGTYYVAGGGAGASGSGTAGYGGGGIIETNALPNTGGGGGGNGANGGSGVVIVRYLKA